jgi:hypothetical protein
MGRGPHSVDRVYPGRISPALRSRKFSVTVAAAAGRCAALVDNLGGTMALTSAPGVQRSGGDDCTAAVDFAEVRGQEHAKRALEAQSRRFAGTRLTFNEDLEVAEVRQHCQGPLRPARPGLLKAATAGAN